MRFPGISKVGAQLLAIILVIAIPLGGAMGYLWLRAVEESHAVATGALRRAADRIAVDLRNLYRQSEWMLSQLAQQPAIREFRAGACDAEALWLRRMHPEFLNVLVWTAAGNLVCSSMEPTPAFSRMPREDQLFRDRLKTSGLDVSDLFHGRIAGQQVVLLSHVIREPDGKALGLVAVALKPSHIDEMLSALRLPEGSAAAILDRKGNFVARVPDGERWRGTSASSLPLDDVPSTAARSTRRLAGIDGFHRLYVSHALPEIGWKIYTGMPSDVLLSRHRQWAFWAIAVTLLVVGACGLLAYAIASRLAREFNRMLAAEQQLSSRLLRAEDGERRHISRELHDQVGSELIALKLDLQLLRRQSASDAMERSLAAVDRLVDMVRDVALALRPPQLDGLGLLVALRSHVACYVQAHGIAVHLDADVAGGRLSGYLETACFRIAQEALTNVLRHAGARNVWLSLREGGRDELVLRLRDDGRGFDVDAALKDAASGRSLGLSNLLDRAQLAGGVLKIHSAPGKGTELEARFPLRDETASGLQPQ